MQSARRGQAEVQYFSQGRFDMWTRTSGHHNATWPRLALQQHITHNMWPIHIKRNVKMNLDTKVREPGSMCLLMACFSTDCMVLTHLNFSFLLSGIVLILSLRFIWIFLFYSSLIQKEQEMMSVPRLSGCNQLWLVAAAIFWEGHIKVLLLGVRVGEPGWSGGNYILTTNLLPIPAKVQDSKSQLSHHLKPEYKNIKPRVCFALSSYSRCFLYYCIFLVYKMCGRTVLYALMSDSIQGLK